MAKIFASATIALVVGALALSAAVPEAGRAAPISRNEAVASRALPETNPSGAGQGPYGSGTTNGPQAYNSGSPGHSRQRYDWPAGAEVLVLRGFSPGSNNWNPGHRGVDLAMGYESPVYAAGSGEVIYAGRLNDRDLVSISHPDGIRTTYEPLTIAVSKGDWVERGQLIGYVTGTHCAPFSCLHWGAKRGQKHYLDPLSLLADSPIRLYPLP